MVFKSIAGGGATPTNLSKMADLKDCKNKPQGNLISIEKRMPINIFNIKNVNYVNTEPHDTSQSIFKNETLKEKRLYDEFKSHLSKSNKKKDKRNRHKSFNNTMGNLSVDNKETSSVKRRKKSMDSKSLVGMMAKVNQIKTSPKGAKLLFQKIVRNFEKSEERHQDFSAIQVLVKHLKGLRDRIKPTKKDRSRSFDRSAGKKTYKSDKSEENTVNLTFAKMTKKLVKEMSGLLQEFSHRSNSRINSGVFKVSNKHCQTVEPMPTSIGLTNLNMPALVKEFSRAFMLSKKIVNRGNENSSGYLKRLEKVKGFSDEQKVALFKDIFSLEQEHLLVEESLRLIQEKGFDLEALFSEGYSKLGITGNNQGQPSHRSQESNEIENASSVTFDSKHLSEGFKSGELSFLPRDTNCYYLDFDKLDVSSG